MLESEHDRGGFDKGAISLHVVAQTHVTVPEIAYEITKKINNNNNYIYINIYIYYSGAI
jgi:hypothetical protein